MAGRRVEAPMKADVFSRYGLPDVVQIKDVERPVPKDNEVLVKSPRGFRQTIRRELGEGYTVFRSDDGWPSQTKRHTARR
jgi:hypothetical protein